MTNEQIKELRTLLADPPPPAITWMKALEIALRDALDAIEAEQAKTAELRAEVRGLRIELERHEQTLANYRAGLRRFAEKWAIDVLPEMGIEDA